MDAKCAASIEKDANPRSRSQRPKAHPELEEQTLHSRYYITIGAIRATTNNKEAFRDNIVRLVALTALRSPCPAWLENIVTQWADRVLSGADR